MGIRVERNPIRVIKYCHLRLYPGKKSGLRFINRRPPGSLEPKIVRLHVRIAGGCLELL
jgi:hypothetical protein